MRSCFSMAVISPRGFCGTNPEGLRFRTAHGHGLIFGKGPFLTACFCALLVTPFRSLAAPAGGCGDLIVPGNWTNRATIDSRTFEMGNGLTYRILSGFQLSVLSDASGQWDWIEQYVGAFAILENVPGTPWYSPVDTNLAFEVQLPSLVVKTRAVGGSSGIQKELAAHAERFAFVATYAGTPTVTNVPEDPDTMAYTLIYGPLDSARFCFRYDPPTSIGPPLSIHQTPVPSPRVELSWSSVAGRLYQLQFCSDLSSGLWEDLQWPRAGNDITLRAVDLADGDAPQRFYRCLAFP
jgi:hypothetical protein